MCKSLMSFRAVLSDAYKCVNINILPLKDDVGKGENMLLGRKISVITQESFRRLRDLLTSLAANLLRSCFSRLKIQLTL